MDTAFFLVSKLAGILLRPDSWIVLAVGLTTLALILDRRRLALVSSALTLLALIVLAVFPIGDLLLNSIEQQTPRNPVLSRVDGIIILGGAANADASAHWGQAQLSEASERYTAALALARAHPAARVLFTGGSADLSGGGRPEAEVAASFLQDQGLAPARLTLETASRNTAENARLSLALARPEPGSVWVLVTSAFHMPRALNSFRAAGWPELVPYPVDYRTTTFAEEIGWDLTRNMQMLNMAIREQLGQLAYRLAGR